MAERDDGKTTTIKSNCLESFPVKAKRLLLSKLLLLLTMENVKSISNMYKHMRT